MKPLTAASHTTDHSARPHFGKWPLILVALLLFGFGGFELAHHRAAPLAAPPISTPQVVPPTNVPAQRLEWQVVNSYPHDPNAFTQGLLWFDGGFYEGTGIEGQSTLRRVEFPSGRVLQKRALPTDIFGEGVAQVGDKLVELSWQSRRGFVWDRKSFKPIGEFTYPNEGWGLTYDGQYLIQSDGTSTLTYLDPQTFQPLRQLTVTFNGEMQRNLNELEWINGAIWANVWQTDQIVRIDPATGQVTAYLDLTGLLPKRLRTGKEDVLNGIAYDAQNKRLFLTGKLWPRLFEVKVQDGGL